MKLRIDQHPAPNSRATIFYVYDEDTGHRTGPFRSYSEAALMLSMREREHDLGSVGPVQPTGGRKIDLATNDERYLRERVRDLECVVKDLLTPVTPGREVYMGHRFIRGDFNPWRLDAARLVLNREKRADEVYTRAKGDLDSKHGDGRRRARRISI